MISVSADMPRGDRQVPGGAEDQLELFRTALDAIGEAVVVTGAELNAPGPIITYVNPAFTHMTGYSAQEAVGQTPPVLQGPLTDRAVLDHLRSDLETREAFQGTAINYRKDGSTYTLHWHITPLRNAAGEITHWIALQREIKPGDQIGELPEARAGRVRAITAQAAAGVAQKVGVPAGIGRLTEQLAQTSVDLQRQVRNTLELVRSIARRTAETHEAAAEYAAHLDGRIDALQRLQSAAMQNQPGGLDLEWLVADELQAFEMANVDRVRISGPAVSLLPRTAETFGLAIHELATNALKFGALAGSNGFVSVRWRVHSREGKPRLLFRWVERGASEPVRLPSHTGFGLRLLEQILPTDLKGRSKLRFAPSGLVCHVDLPMSSQVLQTA
ncbi:PAS domain S-box protein [Methylobacterium nigriterrae]|uniref:PAS domain S-box protein n=1 Tax=Methylobacterium nigriterrae TaxID=3127512 RepID=UPI003013E881